MQKIEWRLAARFSIPPTVSFRGGNQLKMACALCVMYYVIEFSKSTDPLVHLNTLGHLSKYWVRPTACSSYQAPALFVWDVSLCKTTCILSASVLHFSCIESAVGLHSETSERPRLAGLQSCRKPLWSCPTLLQDVECTSEGYFVVLPLKIESDKCNPPVCLLGFLVLSRLHATTKSISRAITKEYI